MASDLPPAVSFGDTHPAISWPAVLAGAVTTLALGLMLSALAAGFDLKVAAPWPSGRPATGEFTPLFGASLIAIQVIASGLGGYLTGRLRAHWAEAHEHEVHFRDTAHGLLAWAVSVVAGAILLGTMTGPPADVAVAVAATTPVDPLRAAHWVSQAALFMAIGLLLSAFISAVAAALGGLRRDEMQRMGRPVRRI
jgi:hypothetical protein